MSATNMSWADDQERLLADALKAVKRNAYFMKKALDDDNLREALKYSAAMLGELRTSQLSPQKYYELYIQVTAEMCNIEAFFADERSRGRTYADLYELVQHAGNVLPRLYLMVAVGCLYIKSGEAKAKEILKDLVDMCKGVQHPTRGLFLRHYLCQQSRNMLPDTGSPYEGDGGNIHDALDFLLSNFIEMNKLWVRMQHQGSIRDRDRRERERQQLQDLVGKNLTYLSQLDGLDYELYSTQVLSRVLEQIVSCKDDIAQQYLMQCVIQCFPDAFHLGTLDSLLGALPDLQSGVKLHALMAQLMDRLAVYASSDEAVLARLHETGAFGKFRDAAARIAEAHTDMVAADVAEMFVALMHFTRSVHPDSADNVNQVLQQCHAVLSPKGAPITEFKAEKQLVALLTLPLKQFDVVRVLGLGQYPALMALLAPRTHKDMATRIVSTILDANTLVQQDAMVAMLFDFISPLVEDSPGASMEDYDEEDIEEEQMLVARLLHQLRSDDSVEEHFKILMTAEQRLLKGGPLRMRHTLPALVFSTLQLVRRMTSAATASATTAAMASAAASKAAPTSAVASSASPEAVLQWAREVCLRLADIPQPVQALRLLLCCAHAASQEACLEMLAYDLFEQAFVLYEESLGDSRQQITALQAIIGTLHRCHIFTPENRDALVAAATSYSSRLLKKPDQCRALLACSHLSWQDAAPVPAASPSTSAPASPTTAASSTPPTDALVAPGPVRDANKVMACLKRALKMANSAKQQLAASGDSRHAHVLPLLHVEILNHYLYYFEQGNELITASVVQQLLELIQNEVQDEKAQEEGLQRFWVATAQHIQCQKLKDGDAKQRFAALQPLPPVAPAAAS